MARHFKTLGMCNFSPTDWEGQGFFFIPDSKDGGIGAGGYYGWYGSRVPREELNSHTVEAGYKRGIFWRLGHYVKDGEIIFYTAREGTYFGDNEIVSIRDDGGGNGAPIVDIVAKSFPIRINRRVGTYGGVVVSLTEYMVADVNSPDQGI